MVALRKVAPQIPDVSASRLARVSLLIDKTVLKTVARMLANCRFSVVEVHSDHLAVREFSSRSSFPLPASAPVARALRLIGRSSFVIEEQLTPEQMEEFLINLMQEAAN